MVAESSKSSKAGKRKGAVRTLPDALANQSSSNVTPVPEQKSHNLLRAQHDGVGDDDEDEDAINSDLDDPEDTADANDEEEENTKQLMLCTYDKVQRVKNKWKCTLKDGILATGGKEYGIRPIEVLRYLLTP